ncbi:MAG: MFS transporter [Pseudomonadota bacterium]
MQLRGIVAAIATISVVGLTTSLSLPLLALILEARGASDTYIGINTMMAGIAAMAVTTLTPRVARIVGFVPFIIAMIILMAVSFYAFFFVENVAYWFPLRIAFHGAITALFVLSEFWINALAPPEKRGLTLGLYATVLSAGFALGPLILSVAGSADATPFILGSLLTAVAVLPVLYARRDAPKMDDAETDLSIWPMFRLAPVAILAAFVFGAAESSGYTFLSLFGIGLGFSEAQSINLVTALALGGFVLQIPIGLLADRIPRRILLLLLALCGTAGGLGLMLAGNAYWLIVAILIFWGGTTSGLYTVGLTHLGSRFTGNALASANAAFIFMYATGMLLGPMASGIAKDVAGGNGYLAVVSLLFLGYALMTWRRIREETANP